MVQEAPAGEAEADKQNDGTPRNNQPETDGLGRSRTVVWRGRRRVLYMSLHRGNGFYPGSGAASDVGTAAGAGFSVNVSRNKASSLS